MNPLFVLLLFILIGFASIEGDQERGLMLIQTLTVIGLAYCVWYYNLSLP